MINIRVRLNLFGNVLLVKDIVMPLFWEGITVNFDETKPYDPLFNINLRNFRYIEQNGTYAADGFPTGVQPGQFGTENQIATLENLGWELLPKE